MLSYILVCSRQDGVETRIQYFEGSEILKNGNPYMQKSLMGRGKNIMPIINFGIKSTGMVKNWKADTYCQNGHKQMEYHFEDDEYHGEAKGMERSRRSYLKMDAL